MANASPTAKSLNGKLATQPYSLLLALRLCLWSVPLRVGEAPAAPEDLVELDIRRQSVAADLGQVGFGRKEQLRGFQYLVITRQPAPIAAIGDLDRVCIGFDGSGLLGLDLGEFLQRGQRARHFLKRRDHGLLVLDLRLLPGSDGRLVVGADPAPLEDRAGQPGRERPDSADPRELGADAAAEAAQDDLWEEIGHRPADLRV